MTAAAVEGDRERCIAAGMDDYIPKPIDPGSVDAALVRWAGDGPTSGEQERRRNADESDGVIDHARLDLLRSMGPADGSLLAKAVQAFLDEAPAYMAALQQATDDEDSEALRRAAHRLKGAAANVGATTTASLCAELESLAVAGDLGRAPEMVRAVEGQLDDAGTALRAAVTPTTG
jgi:two-component system sensor histidine kinase/response regulator